MNLGLATNSREKLREGRRSPFEIVNELPTRPKLTAGQVEFLQDLVLRDQLASSPAVYKYVPPVDDEEDY